MRALLGVLAACALAGCEGRIDSPPAPPVVPVVPEPACGGERLCVGASGLARLTVTEYEATVRAALGTGLGVVSFDGLPGDGQAGPFASNDESPANDDIVAQYQVLAERIAAAASPAGWFGCDLAAVTDDCLRSSLERVGAVLFRAPMSAADTEPYRTLFRAIEARSGASDGARVMLTALLQSPRFLYHVRVGAPVTATVKAEAGDVVQLSGPELAERLAYFLLGGPPDAELSAAGADGSLLTADVLAAQARRLLADPRADASLGRFHTQWLGVEGLPYRSFSATIYPGVEAIRTDLYDETAAFGAYVMRQGDASVRTLLTASWSMVPPALGPFYGVTTPTAGMSRVELPAGERSGLLTHGSFLATHTHDPSTQAVHRGKAIRELLLCQSIPPPPANIDPRINADPTKSPRQRLEAKTSDYTCTACHRLMNPAGFLFEAFDVTGRHRDVVADPASGMTFPVDATGQVFNSDLPGPLDGALALGTALANSDAVDQCVARQWFRYAVARRETAADEKSLAEAYRSYQAAGRNLRELLVAIVQTDTFRLRRSRP